MQLIENPNVLHLHDLQTSAEFFYLIVDRCKGTFYDYVENRKNKYSRFIFNYYLLLSGNPLTENESISFLMQLINGFKGLHEHKIIHRNVNIHNIYITDSGELKIGDVINYMTFYLFKLYNLVGVFKRIRVIRYYSNHS